MTKDNALAGLVIGFLAVIVLIFVASGFYKVGLVDGSSSGYDIGYSAALRDIRARQEATYIPYTSDDSFDLNAQLFESILANIQSANLTMTYGEGYNRGLLSIVWSEAVK